MREHFAQDLIPLGLRPIRPHEAPELGLYHRERCLHVRPLMVRLIEPFGIIAKRVERLAPRPWRTGLRVCLERDERHGVGRADRHDVAAAAVVPRYRLAPPAWALSSVWAAARSRSARIGSTPGVAVPRNLASMVRVAPQWACRVVEVQGPPADGGAGG